MCPLLREHMGALAAVDRLAPGVRGRTLTWRPDPNLTPTLPLILTLPLTLSRTHP